MPDISLLQSDIEIEAKESKISGIFLTISIIFLIISTGSYIGLFFYNSILTDNLDQVIESIENLNLENASNEVGKLNEVEGQLSVIQSLRKNHVDSNKLLAVVSGSVHPKVYYKNTDFDVMRNKVTLTGVALNPRSLSEQVNLYSKNKNILDYEISNISLVDNGVKFSILLNIKK